MVNKTPPKPKYDLVRPSGKKTATPRVRLAKSEQHFSDEDLAEFRKRLLAEYEKGKQSINSKRSEALSKHDEENVEEDGANTSNRDTELTIADDLNHRLKAIEGALRAIDDKTYGICQVCGCLIPRDRLRAFPFAIRCVTCKAEYEEKVAADRRAQSKNP